MISSKLQQSGIWYFVFLDLFLEITVSSVSTSSSSSSLSLLVVLHRVERSCRLLLAIFLEGPGWGLGLLNSSLPLLLAGPDCLSSPLQNLVGPSGDWTVVDLWSSLPLCLGRHSFSFPSPLLVLEKPWEIMEKYDSQTGGRGAVEGFCTSASVGFFIPRAS